MKKIAILTTPNQWFEAHAELLAQELGGADLYLSHDNIQVTHDILYILSYHRIVPHEILRLNGVNLVVHESDLPRGKGWAPLAWQVIEGKKEIVFTMFRAEGEFDSGQVVMKRSLHLTGFELYDELREKQAKLIFAMCVEFAKKPDLFENSEVQVGLESFYPKRTPADSQLDPNKTIQDQFNLLRVVSNNDFPAYFKIQGKKYIIKIFDGEE